MTHFNTIKLIDSWLNSFIRRLPGDSYSHIIIVLVADFKTTKIVIVLLNDFTSNAGH